MRSVPAPALNMPLGLPACVPVTRVLRSNRPASTVISVLAVLLANTTVPVTVLLPLTLRKAPTPIRV